MSEQMRQFSNQPEPAADSSEQRFWIRYPSNRDTTCQPESAPTASGPELSWPARVWDISLGGISLLLERRFEPQTPVQLVAAANGPVQVLGATVVRVSQQNDGRWLIGCQFSEPLSEDQLQRLWHNS